MSSTATALRAEQNGYIEDAIAFAQGLWRQISLGLIGRYHPLDQAAPGCPGHPQFRGKHAKRDSGPAERAAVSHLQAAFSQAYDEVAKFGMWQMVLVIGAAVLGPIIGAISPTLMPWVALLALLVLGIDVLFLEPSVEYYQDLGGRFTRCSTRSGSNCLGTALRPIGRPSRK